jgi:hypothetical protein
VPTLADVIDRRPWRLLAATLAIVAVAAPLGIHVRHHLKPRGFELLFAVDTCRPLYARVAFDNVGSRRVLEKCGFRVIASERAYADARSGEIEEFVRRLSGEATTSFGPRRISRADLRRTGTMTVR